MKYRLQKLLAVLLCMAVLSLTALPLGAWAAESGIPALEIECDGYDYTLSADDPDGFSEFEEAMDEEEVPLTVSYDAETTTFTLELQDEDSWGFDDITITGSTGNENVTLTSPGTIADGALTVENIHDFTAVGTSSYTIFNNDVTIDCTGKVSLGQDTSSKYSDSAVFGALTISNAASVELTGSVEGDVEFTDCGNITATGNSFSAVLGGTIRNCGDLTVTNNSGKAVSNLTFTSNAGSSVNLNSSGTAVSGSSEIDTTGSVTILSASGAAISGTLTVNHASEVSITSTSGSIGGGVILDVPGNVTLSSPNGSSAGALEVKNANNVTITGQSANALIPITNDSVSISCSGDLKLSNTAGPLVGTSTPPDESLLIQKAGSVTLEAASTQPAVTGSISITSCTGDVSITNQSGPISNHALTIGSAADVTVRGKTSGYLFGTAIGSKAAVSVTCSGAANFTNASGGIVYDDLTVKGASALTLNGSCTTPLVYGDLQAECTGNAAVSITNKAGNISSTGLTLTGVGPVSVSGNDNDALVKTGDISITSNSGNVTLQNEGSSSTSIAGGKVTILGNGDVTMTGSSDGKGMLVTGKTSITTAGSVSLTNTSGGICSGDFSASAGDVTVTCDYDYFLFSESTTIDSTGDVRITNTAGPLVEGIVGPGDLKILSAASVTLTGNSTNDALLHGDAAITSSGDVTIANEGGALMEDDNDGDTDVMDITTPGSVSLTGSNAAGALAPGFAIQSHRLSMKNEASGPLGKVTFTRHDPESDYTSNNEPILFGDGNTKVYEDDTLSELNIEPVAKPDPKPDPDPDPDPEPEPDPVAPADGDSIGGTVVAVAAGGAAVWGGYEITTRVILHKLLPQGAAIPTNRGALALLVWDTAGRPEPAAAPAFADVTDADLAQAAQWCVEQGLLDARSDGTFAPEGWVPKFRTIAVWCKAFPAQKLF